MEINVKRLERKGQAPRSPAEPDCFISEGVNLRPAACTLASAGKHPVQVGVQASGAWRGSLAAADAAAAAALLAPVLEGTVSLHGCGTFADAELLSGSLRFRKVAPGEEDAEAPGKAQESGSRKI